MAELKITTLLLERPANVRPPLSLTGMKRPDCLVARNTQNGAEGVGFAVQ